MATPEQAHQAEWASTVRISRLLDQIAENARAHKNMPFGLAESALEDQLDEILSETWSDRAELRLKLVNLAGLALAWLVQIDEENLT